MTLPDNVYFDSSRRTGHGAGKALLDFGIIREQVQTRDLLATAIPGDRAFAVLACALSRGLYVGGGALALTQPGPNIFSALVGFTSAQHLYANLAVAGERKADHWCFCTSIVNSLIRYRAIGEPGWLTE